MHPDVEQPKHPLHTMTTFELRDYRRELETALAYYAANHPAAPARTTLQAKLDAVLAEQDDRAKIAHA